jgi:hypothetical protein
MVHVSASGDIFVLGIMMSSSASNVNGQNNIFLNYLWDAAAKSNGNYGVPSSADIKYDWQVESDTYLSPYTDFLPTSRAFYHYNGSLTTVPCTEGVAWIVFEQPVFLSSEDLTNLRDSVAAFPGTIIDSQGDNNRPIQSLNGRTVLRYAGTDAKEIYDNKIIATRDHFPDTPTESGFSGGIIAGLTIGLLFCFGIWIYYNHDRRHSNILALQKLALADDEI